MFAVFQQHDFPEDSTCLGKRLEEIHDFLDSNKGAITLPNCLGHIPIRAFTDDFLDFVLSIEILAWKDLINIVIQVFSPHFLFCFHCDKIFKKLLNK